MIRMRIDNHMFEVSESELTDEGLKAREVRYSWTSGESGYRRWRSLVAIERRDGWYAQVIYGGTDGRLHGPDTLHKAIRLACERGGLAWPPEAGKP